MLDGGWWCCFRFRVTRPGTTLFRAELAMEYPHVVVQFVFRLVPGVALTTGGIGHPLSPYCEAASSSRLFEDSLYLAKLLLDIPGNPFADAFAFQVGIVREFARLFFDLALEFVSLPCDLILNAGFHMELS
jgi:hypothetical protein